MEDSTKFLLDLLFLVVLVGLIIAAYFVFKNSTLGKVFGDVFGDLDGFLGWAGSQLSSCVNDGLTSKGCTIGPWMIGVIILFALISILGALGIPEIFKSKLAKLAETSETTKDIVSKKSVEDMVSEEMALQEKDPKRADMSDEAKIADIRLRVIKRIGDEIQKTVAGNDPTTGQDAKAATISQQSDIKEEYDPEVQNEIEDNDPGAFETAD